MIKVISDTLSGLLGCNYINARSHFICVRKGVFGIKGAHNKKVAGTGYEAHRKKKEQIC